MGNVTCFHCNSDIGPFTTVYGKIDGVPHEAWVCKDLVICEKNQKAEVL